jgi:hypothetical protein
VDDVDAGHATLVVHLVAADAYITQHDTARVHRSLHLLPGEYARSGGEADVPGGPPGERIESAIHAQDRLPAFTFVENDGAAPRDVEVEVPEAHRAGAV